MIILGIDPGTNITGYGIIKKINKEKLELITFGIIDLRKISNHYLKLKEIFKQITVLIKKYSPEELAIEAPFYGKNVQSMLKLGRSQGVAIVAAANFNLPINEYSPRKIKMAITGNGNASKEQVALILNSIINKKILNQLDATDAIAVAVCHSFQNKTYTTNKNYSDWKDFANKNPDKII